MSTMVDYGYGDAAPDSADKYGYGDYGYGDAAPDSADKYGYGDAAPDDAAKYGYGDSQPSNGNNNSNTDYGYGDAQPDYGYGDAAPTDYGSTDGDGEPKRRPRRRNSVTRYSLVCQDQVKNEFAAHENMIDQFRNGMVDAPAGPPPQMTVPLNDGSGSGGGAYAYGSQHSSDGYDSCDLSADGMEGEKKEKSKKKRRGWGFRLGRSGSKDAN
mmetsp:Transcript_2812/g.4498  ORF Transcript_2812/g.4498 Transcript_2812/m.4498 type:complete len:212 (-) Transcript_2812:221-856(-)